MRKDTAMKYALDDKLPFLSLLIYGLQWWVVAVPSIIVMGVVVANLHFSGDLAAQIFYMQKLFGIVGIFMLLQTLWGHKLPLVAGPASILLIGILSSLSSGLPAIYTAIFVGGILISALALTGLLSHIQAIFTPRVITVILVLIAFTLVPVILRLVFSDEAHPLFNLFFSCLFVLCLVVLNRLLRGVWKSTTLIWGIVLGTLICFGIHGIPVLPEYTGIISTDKNNFFISFQFDPGVILAFIFCFLALIINELGSIQAVGHILNAGDMQRRSKWGISFAGMMNMFSGMIGVIGTVDYSMSPGVISATGCASRYPLIPASILLIICAFFPEMVRVLLLIPSVVMGSLLLYLISTQLAAGLQMLVREQAISNYNHGIVVALPLMIALFITFTPATVLEQLPTLLRPIIGNSFVMGVFSVLLMEHLIFPSEKKH